MSGSLASAPARAGAWIRDRIRARALILGYHRVAEYDWDPAGLVVRPERFREQLNVLRRFGTIVPLGRIPEFLDGRPLPRPAVALTFDDGYRDNLSVLLPVLEEFELPATVFVTTGPSGAFFWWDELSGILHPENPLPPRLELAHPELDSAPDRLRTVLVVGSGPIERARLHTELADRISRLQPDERTTVLAGIRAWAAHSRQPDTGARSLTPSDIASLARAPLIEVGAHSVSHSRLAEVEADDLRREVADSIAAVADATGHAAPGFSYPHGSTSGAVRGALGAAGVDYACASHGDLVARATDPMLLPRFWPGDFDGPRFFRWLHARWLGL